MYKIQDIRITDSRFSYQVIRFKPTDLNIILGKNGSGKSSLIKELSPLPPEFKTTTRKTIWLTNGKGDEFVLDYVNKKNSFVVNGKEINTTGRKNIQLKLIEEYFNYDNFLHKVLHYRDFTAMSPAERKHLIKYMTNADFYLFNILERAKNRMRDIKAILTLLRGKKNGLNEVSEREIKSLEDANFRNKELLESLSNTVKNIEARVDVSTYKDIMKKFKLFGDRRLLREDIDMIRIELSRIKGELDGLEIIIKSNANKIK